MRRDLKHFKNCHRPRRPAEEQIGQLVSIREIDSWLEQKEYERAQETARIVDRWFPPAA